MIHRRSAALMAEEVLRLAERKTRIMAKARGFDKVTLMPDPRQIGRNAFIATNSHRGDSIRISNNSKLAMLSTAYAMLDAMPRDKQIADEELSPTQVANVARRMNMGVRPRNAAR